jgi:hypothetical protein
VGTDFGVVVLMVELGALERGIDGDVGVRHVTSSFGERRARP